MKLKYDLRKRRKALGMTLEQVAAKAGLTPGAVRWYEVGNIRGRIETRQRLAAALDISPRLLMTDAEQKAVYGDVRREKKIQAFIQENDIPQDKAIEVLRSWAELRDRKRG